MKNSLLSGLKTKSFMKGGEKLGKVDIAEYLKQKTHTFVSGFMDGLYSEPPKSPMFNREEYVEGYADGAQYKDELNGTAPSTLIRRI